MKTHSLIQSSPAWHVYRAQHFNASDAPAMMGCSPYETRTQLMARLKTGIAPDVGPATQRRYDDGHRYEAMARPLAEKIIGQDLYPVVGSEGELSASFDGLTMDESVCFEHKSMNDDLRKAFAQIDTIAPNYIDKIAADELPMHYRVQMEQQLAVSGSEKCLFMASNWDRDTLIEERHCWYYSDPELRAQIIAGWEQFAQDLVDFKPEPVTVEAVGRTPETLPALHIEVTGMVTASNLQQYKDHALAVFAGINRDLTTDQDFATAESVVKWCGDVESRLAAAKQHALSQTESIDALFKAIDDISAEAKRTRLELDKLVTKRKADVRLEIQQEAAAAFIAHYNSLNVRLGKPYMPTIVTDFAGAMKGKRTVTSLKDAVATELARAKIEANAIADKIQINLGTLRELAGAHAFLFADTGVIVQKAPEDLTMLVKSRIAEHQAAEAARIEAERARIRQEEIDRLAREQAERDRAEAKRIADEAAKVAAEAAQANKPTEWDIAATKVDPNPQKLTVGQQAIVDAIPIKQAPSVIQARQPAPSKEREPTPNLSLGEISTRLGFNVTSAFLSSLGFEATTVRAAKLYHSDDFQAICEAIKVHVGEVQDQYEAATA